MEKVATVYKVVRNLGGVLVSAIRGPVVLKYVVGEPTEACDALPEAGPLAFDTFEAARKFARFERKLADLYNQPYQFEIYVALGEDVAPVHTLSRGMTPEDRRSFWQNPELDRGVEQMAAPTGSVVTKRLTLGKKIWDGSRDN